MGIGICTWPVVIHLLRDNDGIVLHKLIPEALNCLSLDVGQNHWRGSRSARCWLGAALLTGTRQSAQDWTVELLCEAHHCIVIVGLPMMLDGTEGRSARLARQIGTALEDLGL